MRDFIHISDCVLGVVKSMDKIDDGSAINLSTGQLTSLKFVKIASNILNFHPEVEGTSTARRCICKRRGYRTPNKIRN